MYISTVFAAAFAGLAAADYTMTLVPLDDVNRTVIWTHNPGLPDIPPTIVEPGKNVTVQFTSNWCGNGYAVNEGEHDVPGMLVEWCFSQYGTNKIFYDVSAIVNPANLNGIQAIYPADEPWEPMSGCPGHWPCDNAYWHPDDIQTKAASTSDMIVLLGTNGNGVATRSLESIIHNSQGKNYPREAVLNPFWREQ